MSLIRRALGPALARRGAPGNAEWGNSTPPSNSMIFGAPSAGISVSEGSALQVAAVYGSVGVIADAVSTLPLMLVNSKEAAKRKRLPPSRLMTEPYAEISLTDWWTQYTLSMALRGNFFGEIIERDKMGYPQQVKPIHPDQASVRRLPSGTIEYRFNGKVVANQNVVHVRYLTVAGALEGLNPIEYLRNSLGLARAQDVYGSAWFQNSAIPSGVLEVEDDLDDEEVLSLARQWMSTHQGLNQANLPAVLTGGTTFKAISITPEDSQFLQCVTPDTLITMADGTRARADSIQTGDLVEGWDIASKRLTASAIEAVGRNKPAPLIRVRTHRGRELTTTANHPYLASWYVSRKTGKRGTRQNAQRTERTQGEWCLAEDLSVGDYVRVGMGYAKAGTVSFEEGWMVGALVGDGHIRANNNIEFTNIDTAVINRMRACAETLGGNLRTAPKDYTQHTFTGFAYGKRNRLRNLMREHRLLGTRSRTKFVPDRILTGGQDAWVGFLSGYLDADGSVVHENARQPKADWSSVSKQLLEGCQFMLAGLGVQASLYEERGKYCDRPHTRYSLNVCGRSQVAKLADLLKPCHPEKVTRLQHWANVPAKTNEDTDLQTEWDRVVAIEEIPEGETVLLTVAGTHSHVTNGLITHNSREFSQSEICGMLFRVPPHMVGIVDRSTSWGRGIEQQETGFVRNTLAGYLVRGERMLTALHPPNQYVEFDINQRMRGDKLERYQAYSLGMLGGWEYADEVRAEEGKAPLPNGIGETVLAPINTEPLEAMLEKVKAETEIKNKEAEQEFLVGQAEQAPAPSKGGSAKVKAKPKAKAKEGSGKEAPPSKE